MPELPEVETVRRGIAPLVLHREVVAVVVRDARLRWPVPANLAEHLVGRPFVELRRRGKYLLLRNAAGWLILHLGMSGHVRCLPATTPAGRHDHVDIVFCDGRCLRLNDPRRFGALLWTAEEPARHPLLASLGPEPLEPGFDGDYLYGRSRGRRVAVKNFIMDHRIVAGVGNIYASEALFRAGIHPGRPAGRIARQRYERLAEALRQVLTEAIEAGGTTLRDFADENGRPGYFAVQLSVYGRTGEPCPNCDRAIACEKIGQRSSYFCPRCQR
jgi:formamidopyrimidine-DNA glycosylase